MIILVSILLSVLVITDFLLIKYCQAKNHFSLFAFSFLILALAVLMLMMTGDITIAMG